MGKYQSLKRTKCNCVVHCLKVYLERAMKQTKMTWYQIVCLHLEIQWHLPLSRLKGQRVQQILKYKGLPVRCNKQEMHFVRHIREDLRYASIRPHPATVVYYLDGDGPV